MAIETETTRINRLILRGGQKGLTETEFFAREIQEWLNGPRRMAQLQGDAYYNGDHDILRRKRTVIGQDGSLQVVENLPNNHIVDNRYGISRGICPAN